MNALLNILIPILMLIESGNDPNAIGDQGKAVGVLQISPIMIKDVNRIVGETRYFLKDRKDPDKSGEMCKIYLGHYGKRILNGNLSQQDKLVGLGRLWNGGPRGDKKKSTLKYGEKILQALEANDHKIIANISEDEAEIYDK